MIKARLLLTDLRPVVLPMHVGEPYLLGLAGPVMYLAKVCPRGAFRLTFK